MSTHTPGPWQAMLVKNANRCFWAVCATEKLATVLVPIKGNREANAHLMAAAPDLLAVVTELASTPWENIHLRALQEKARAAIARAEGYP